MAHALTDTEYSAEPLLFSESATRYGRIDYTLVLLFIFFSDEFHALARDNAAQVLLIAICFLLSDGVHLLDATVQWARLARCVTQCVWRCIFYALIRCLQQRVYKKEE